MFVEEVRSRLEAQVPALAHRVHGAADLARLMAAGKPPQVTPAAHVLPGGLQGGRDDGGLAVGLFRQAVRRVVTVILTLRVHDKLGQRALDALDALLDAVITAICGWQPDPAIGPFTLRSGRVLSMAGGALSYQIDFQIADEVRISP